MVACFFPVLGVPTEARARDPFDFEVAAKAGYGTNPYGGDLNPLGFGLGGRSGMSFRNIYIGVSFVDYVGGRVDAEVPGPVSNHAFVSVSIHALMYGIEAGYSFALLDLVTIRPQLGIGNDEVNASVPGHHLYLEPGIVAIAPLGVCFAGVGVNLLLLPALMACGSSWLGMALTLDGQVGIKF